MEIVRRTWDAWVRRDIDGVTATHDRAAEWDTSSFEGWPEDDVYVGHAGVRRFLEAWLASWERFEAGADEYLVVDGDRLLVLCWQRAFGQGSHVPAPMDYAALCTLKRGLVCRIKFYSDQQEALVAVGLSE